jgi:hypothetical protein
LLLCAADQVLLQQQGDDTRCGNRALGGSQHTEADMLGRAQRPHALAAGWKASLRCQAITVGQIALSARAPMRQLPLGLLQLYGFGFGD